MFNDCAKFNPNKLTTSTLQGMGKSPHVHKKIFRPWRIGLKCFKNDISILMQTVKISFDSIYPDIQIFKWIDYPTCQTKS